MQTDSIWLRRGDISSALPQAAFVSSFTQQLLAQRAIDDIDRFLSPSLKDLTEPLLFVDMAKAVVKITDAIINRRMIGLFGDYDVDGVCSTALMSHFLTALNAPFCATLPHRMTEGYGLNQPGIDRLHQAGAELIIALDCGITAHTQVDYASSLGMDVIVVDHHEPEATLPKAFALINPKRKDCTSKADYLCAAGVSFFLISALRRELREKGYFSQRAEPDLKELLDLVALATVCDVVPLIKNNRILVKHGLKIIKEGKRPGLNALIEAAGVNREKISSTNLGFHLGPRINAAGRLEDATMALTLLNELTPSKAATLAEALNTTNQERKELEQTTVDEAILLVEKCPDYQQLFVLVLHQEHWHPGVVGIVASRIAERFHKPSIIIGEKGKGSGRSIAGVDLHALVNKAAAHLSGFGGHAHAIGVTLGPGGVEPFKQALFLEAERSITRDVYAKKIYYDSEVTLDQISLKLIDELTLFEPCGAKNPYPVMRINRCFLRNLRNLQGGHCKGELESASGYASFIAFRTEIPDELSKIPIDVLAVLEKNEWQGRITPQLRIIDYKKSLPKEAL